MKILCVSDTVMPQLENAANLRRRYSDVNLIISCGDMPSNYLEFITSILRVPLFYVRGNHDENYDKHPPGGEDLHQKVVSYGGLTFTGLEGCRKYNKGTIQYTESQMARMVIRKAPWLYPKRLIHGRGVDVLVTHSPPHDIHDAEDLPHRGFKSLRWFLKWYRPKYMFHGHVHTYDRRKTTTTRFEDTCVVNINPFTIFEITPNSNPICL